MEKESAGFVGRRAELAVLDEALGRAIRFNAPQTVTIVGADGLGKSRLIDEWVGSHAGENLRIVRAAVDPPVGAGGAAPRGALIAHLLRVRFGLAELSPDDALLQFRAQLQEVFGDRRILELSTLLGRFLGFDLPESPLGSALAGRPEQGAELARAVLARFLEQDAAGRALVIVGENLQDADDDSLVELESLAAELVDSPILIVATARPDLLVRRPGWGRGGGNHTRIDLQPLTRMEIDLLVSSYLGPAAAVPPGLAEGVATESGGNPHLAGEVLRAYREHGLLVVGAGGAGWRFDRDRAARQHPTATREEVAYARITVLTPVERDVLARAAIFGGEFWTGGVVALDPTITEIHQILESLRERGFVERVAKSSIPEETAWAFCQTIERRLLEADAASELTKRRKIFAAQWLESRDSAWTEPAGARAGASRDGTAIPAGAAPPVSAREQRLEALARLYEEAGDARRAAYCFVTAASLARDHLRLDRAHALYMAGLRLLDLDDAVAKRDALYAAGDVAARLGRTREAVGLFQEMLRLAWRLDLPAKGGAAHGRIGRLLSTLGENARARSHLELAQKLFEVAGDWPGVAAALDDVGRIHFLMGEPEHSLERHRAALGVREQLGDDRGRALTLSRLGQVLRATGALAAAGENFRAALELRRRISDLPGVIASLLDLGALERDLGRRPEALSLLREGRDLARASGERLQECSLSIEIGDCHLADGQPNAAIAEFQAAREMARQFGARGLLSEATRGIAEAELALGEAARARDDARSAFEIAERAGAPPLAGAALRVAAAAVGAGAPGESDLGGAREMFDRAVEVLTGAGAEMELARTLDAYAEFEDRSGRDETASELRRQARLIRHRETPPTPAA
jgi:tetratricopeptide (TPR) repeat protein